MDVTTKVPDFGFSTELNEAHDTFGENLGIIAYVEAYDDVTFWTEEFRKLAVDVDVQAISNVSNANGKNNILSSLKENRINLGKRSLICIDSDYDYILSFGEAPYDSDFCFQTYAYAIENYYFNPIGLTACCNKAACYYKGVAADCLEVIMIQWSQYIHGAFLNKLINNETKIVQEILLSLNDLSLDIKEFEGKRQHSLTEEQLEEFSKKGLKEDNVFLYFRGHDLQTKLLSLAISVYEKLSFNAIADIKNAPTKKNLADFIKEYTNKRMDVETVINTRENFPVNHCYELLKRDIVHYKKGYVSH